jgi:DNA-binding Xre family transcriptional regulator
MPKINKLPRNASIFLNDSFRVAFIKKAIEKAGSMRQLGRIMGYTSEAPNWSIKQILYGKQGIPLFRLEKLCKFMSVSLIDIESYIVKFCSPKD